LYSPFTHSSFSSADKPRLPAPGVAMPRNTFGSEPTPKPTEPKITSYESKELEIPEDYLVSEPYDAKPILFTPIDFSKTTLPEYHGGYAVILDNVLSPSECTKLIQLAESSVLDKDRAGDSPWQPALVNIGFGMEVLQKDYRNSDRIIWDNQVIVDRIWARIEKIEGITEQLSSIKAGDLLGWKKSRFDSDSIWEFHQVNKRLRFLKYGSGQFFRPHCDSPYGEVTQDGKVLETYFTVHLYLNDSKAEGGPDADLVGGATSFLSSDSKRRLDVNPKAGRVLIFQHKRLLHSGDDVVSGIKYTVRTDIMYELREVEEDSVMV